MPNMNQFGQVVWSVWGGLSYFPPPLFQFRADLYFSNFTIYHATRTRKARQTKRFFSTERKRNLGRHNLATYATVATISHALCSNIPINSKKILHLKFKEIECMNSLISLIFFNVLCINPNQIRQTIL